MADTADCTLVIPLRSPRPDSPAADRIALCLHTQRLSAKSVLLRGLLRGRAPVDLIHSIATSRLHSPAVPARIPRSHLPRLLPSPPSHPVLFLPVPDPSSIQYLFHWMYSGRTDHIQNALDQGLVQWVGLAHNAEYLCLSTDIKVFLGRWYRNRFLSSHPLPLCTPCPTNDDDHSDSDDDHSPPHPSTDDETQDEDECTRGRTRDAKPLEQLCSQLRLSTT